LRLQQPPSHIIILAIRFKNGAWKDWEHTCSEEEVEAVVDSARAKAFEQYRYRNPSYADFLDGARYIFNIIRGPLEKPMEGDTRVYGVSLDKKVIRRIEEPDLRSVLK
jgi:hypothetical protein